MNETDKSITKFSAMNYAELLLGRLGLKDEEYKDTPKRFAALMEALLCRHHEEMPKLTTFPTENNEMVTVGPIDFYSLCPHHLALILGKAYVGYIPKGKVLGLSKIPRLVRWLSGTLIKQEDLTVQIAKELEKALFSDADLISQFELRGGPPNMYGPGYSDRLVTIPRSNGVAVALQATHTCMLVRGVKVNSECLTSTSTMTGCFLDPGKHARGEFLALVRGLNK